jgi:hypothetical protein
MADNFLERHREEYEQRKQRWLLRKKLHLHPGKKGTHRTGVDKPEDEAL